MPAPSSPPANAPARTAPPAAPPPRARYLALPVAAFRASEDFDPARLPARVAQRPWRGLAVLLFVLAGFVLVMNGIIALEDRFAAQPGAEDWTRFRWFTWALFGALAGGGAWAWFRVDEVELDRERVRIRRVGPLGADVREAALESYRGVRARERYVEDYEVTTGTTYWDVELEHADPRLTVALFARERHEPRDADARRPGPDRPDWTHEMRAFAERCSRDLDLPLLTDPT